MTIAKLPLAKDIDGFAFDSTPINETLVRDLSSGAFLAEQRNAVFIGETGTGKTHLAIAIARACIRGGARGRFYNVVDLVNRLESEARAGRQGRMADYLSRLDFVVLDEFGYLPFCPGQRAVALPSGEPALRTRLHHRHHQPCLRRISTATRRASSPAISSRSILTWRKAAYFKLRENWGERSAQKVRPTSDLQTLFQIRDQRHDALKLLRVLCRMLPNTPLKIGKERFLVAVTSSNSGPFCPQRQIS
jgi:hypothetical protein